MIPSNTDHEFSAPDDELNARLDAALRSGLGSDQVDVGALLRGTHNRARIMRTRRIAVAGIAVILLIGLPAGFEVLRNSPGAQGPPAALLQSTQPRATASNDGQGLYLSTPDPLELEATNLPPEAKLSSRAWLPTLPIISGRYCTPGQAGVERPLSVRQWVWQGDAGKPADLRIQINLSHWGSAGSAAQAFNQVVQGVAGCRWQQPQTVEKYTADDTGAVPQEIWTTTSAQDGIGYGRAVLRVEDWIGGVEVRSAAGRPAAVELAQQLAGLEATRLREYALPSASPSR